MSLVLGRELYLGQVCGFYVYVNLHLALRPSLQDNRGGGKNGGFVYKCSIICGLRNRLTAVNIVSSSHFKFSLPLCCPSNSLFKMYQELISSCVYSVTILSL